MGAASGDQLAHSVIKPLVVGTEPLAGECLSSVLVRACEANVFTKPMHLLKLIGLRIQATEFAPFTHAGAASDIALLLGANAEAIHALMHSPVEDWLGRSTVNWFGSPIERRHIEASVRRFAPRSLENGRHYRASWGVRLLDYCPITMELLVSECPQCFQPLGWRACRNLLKCEKCEASLERAESRNVQSQYHKVARLGAALVSARPTDRQTALSTLPKPLRTWAPSDALLGLLTLGEAQVLLESSNDPSKTAGSAEYIAAGLAFARDWPNSLSKFVKASTSMSNSTSTRTGLGTLGKLFQGGSTATPIRNLVRSTISASLGQAMVPAKLYPGAMVNEACRAGALSAREAEEYLGISRKSLRRLEGRSDTFLIRHNVHGGPALYNRKAIESLSDAMSRSVRPNDCARELGIPSYCVASFISAGLVKLVENSDALIVADDNLISRLSITSLRDCLRNQSEEFDGGVRLLEAMRRVGTPQDWVSVFQKMLSGRISLKFSDTDDTSLTGAIVVSDTDLASCRGSRLEEQIGNEIHVSCLAAAGIVGTSAQFISAAVQAGFIEGKVGMQKSTIPLGSVLDFQRHFIVSEEVCEIVGANRRRIGFLLNDAGYEPAAVINRTRIWQRSDIERFIEKRADAPLTGN